MHRLLHIAVATLILAGFAEDAAAATWRLAQSKGETITLTVTDTAIHIVARDSHIEILLRGRAIAPHFYPPSDPV
jgi:hypothetical protein